MEKQVLSVRLEKAIIDRLKQICEAEDASQSKIIKRMINKWPVEEVKPHQAIKPSEPVIENPVAIKREAVITPVKKEAIKPIEPPKKFNLLEAMAQASKA